MMTNRNFAKAKSAKNDEFYTQLSDIESELRHYVKHFRGKVVYCNCDSEHSNFVKYFNDNAARLGIKKLLWGSRDFRGQRSLFDEEENGALEKLRRADIVVTNPPFSLFREYVAQLVEHDKKFLILGPMNAVSYKEIFPLIKDNKLWLGYKPMGKDMLFDVPGHFAKELVATKKEGSGYKIIDNVVKARSSAIWFTNLTHRKRNDTIDLWAKYSKKEYPKYDNYDAIEVGKVDNIPADYAGVMGVPITFLGKYNPSQFEIVKFRKGDDEKDLAINGRRLYFRILIRNKELQQ